MPLLSKRDSNTWVLNCEDLQTFQTFFLAEAKEVMQLKTVHMGYFDKASLAKDKYL